MLVVGIPLIPCAGQIVVAQVYAEVNSGFEGEQDRNPARADFGAVLGWDAGIGQGEVGAALPVIVEFKCGLTTADIFDGELVRRAIGENFALPLVAVGEDEVNVAVSFRRPALPGSAAGATSAAPGVRPHK